MARGSNRTKEAEKEHKFQEQTLRYAELVDRELIRLIGMSEQVPHLHDGVLYSMGLDEEDRAIRGKRIRPALCLLTAEMLGTAPRNALTFACAIELLHNFALVHDDIEDGDSMRRGRPCTHVQYGLAHGINIGDFMLAKVFYFISRDPHMSMAVREQLIELLHRTLDHLFIGQSLDISARGQRHFTMTEYERLVAMKTGSYLVAPMLGGAIIAHAQEDTIEGLTKLGNALGPLFQIKDDIIDLTQGKGRGVIGSDIREGKRSYLVAAAAEKCSVEERERLFDILDREREETAAEDIQWVLELYERHGAVARGEQYCEELQSHALEAIKTLPKALRESLETATRILVSRTT